MHKKTKIYIKTERKGKQMHRKEEENIADVIMDEKRKNEEEKRVKGAKINYKITRQADAQKRRRKFKGRYKRWKENKEKRHNKEPKMQTEKTR